MNLRNPIPDYFISRKNTVLQIVFTTIFAYAFINIYDPFASSIWYEVSKWKFLFYTAALVLFSMVIVIISRVIVLGIRKKHKISIGFYLLMILLEILFMALLYTLLEKFFIKDQREYERLYIVAVQNTALILLIPYIISSLFFAWQENKSKLNQVLNKQMHLKEKTHLFFYDENGKMRFSIDSKEVLYIKSADNYVEIFYIEGGDTDKFTLRNNLKALESDDIFPMLRCHRSFMVNAAKVKVVRRTNRGLRVQLDYKNIQIPLTPKYKDAVINVLQPTKQKKIKYF